MYYLILDDEPIILEDIARTIKPFLQSELGDTQPELLLCSRVASAMELLEKYPVAIAFLDIDLPRGNGITVAEKVNLLYPDTHVVFVTGHPQYSLDAWSVKAFGFLLKPVLPEDLKRVLQYIKPNLPYSKLKITCFGEFQVYWNRFPLVFKRKRTLELMAILVDSHGKVCSNSYLSELLWGDVTGHESFLRDLKSDLINTLRSIHQEQIVHRQRGGISLLPELVDCDYFCYLSGEIDNQNMTHQYMEQYDWAEHTVAALYFRKMKEKH